MPDLLAAAGDLLPGVGDFFSSLFTPAAAAGADAAGTAAADLAGPTAAGTAADYLGQGGFDALAGGAAAGTGADVLSTAGSFLAAPGASGFLPAAAGIGGAAADTALSSAANTGLASGISDILPSTAPATALAGATPTTGFGTSSVSPASASLSPNVANANASGNVFETGTQQVPGVGAQGQPNVTGASSFSAPSGVTANADPTASGGLATGGTPTNTNNSSISDLLGDAGTGALKSLTSNPLGIGLGAAGLGYNILQGQKQTANTSALSADAATATANSNQMVASGEALQNYLTSGTLPPQYMTQVDQAIADAKTSAISNAAAQGQPTDPTRNTALATTLAKIDASRPGMISQVAGQLFSSGTSLVSAGQSAAGLSGQLYQALVANDTTQAHNTGQAIATLAAALNGKTSVNAGSTNITVSPS